MKMFVVLCALVLGSVACGSGGSSSSTSKTTLMPVTTSGVLTMTMSFDPSPPKQGNETISISVKDASGKAVKGAVVTATTHMPAMSMSGPALTFQDNGDGTYSAVTNINYRTKWKFSVSATRGGEFGKTEFVADVP